MHRIAIVLFVLAACVGCKPRGASVRFDSADLTRRAAERVGRVLNEPEVSSAFNELFEVVGADPSIRERGAALLGAIGQDPATAQAIAQLMGTLQQAPELGRLVTELVAANPGVSAEQIGELVSKRVETTWASPPINQAWMRAWERLRVKLSLGPIPPTLSAGIGGRLERYLNANSERWGERLIELAGGKLPSPARATDLYFERAWSEARIRGFLRGVLSNPRMRQEIIGATQRLLQLEVVQRELRVAAAAFLSDRAVQQAALEVMLLLVTDAPPPERVERALDRMLQSPPVAQAINQLLAHLLADPEVPKVLMDAFGHLAADRQLAAEVEKLLNGW